MFFYFIKFSLFFIAGVMAFQSFCILFLLFSNPFYFNQNKTSNFGDFKKIFYFFLFPFLLSSFFFLLLLLFHNEILLFSNSFALFSHSLSRESGHIHCELIAKIFLSLSLFFFHFPLFFFVNHKISQKSSRIFPFTNRVCASFVSSILLFHPLYFFLEFFDAFIERSSLRPLSLHSPFSLLLFASSFQ